MGILTGDTNIDRNVLGLSKPLTKLIEAISEGVKGIAAPWQMKRIAKAELDIKKMNLIAEKEHQALETISGIDLNKLTNRELRGMQNINNVVRLAYDELLNEDPAEIPDEKVNPDWASLYFDFIEKVSDEDAQMIWGKILAGEIKSPGSFSLKTLHTIFYSSKDDIDSFVSLTKFVFNGFLIVTNHKTLYKDNPIKFIDYERSQSLGFVNTTPIASGITIDKDGYTSIGNKCFPLKRKNENDELTLSLQGFSLTPLGEELFKLGAIEPTKEIMEFFKKNIEARYPVELIINQ